MHRNPANRRDLLPIERNATEALKIYATRLLTFIAVCLYLAVVFYGQPGMTANASFGLFTVGAVLLLIAIAGNQFKLFGIKIHSALANPYIRTFSAFLALIFLMPTLVPIVQTYSPNVPPAVSAKPTQKDCILTIVNPFVALKRDPIHFSAEIGAVKPGRYPSKDYRVVAWAGRSEGWFQVESEGRTGWIVDNAITIESKTDPCPP